MNINIHFKILPCSGLCIEYIIQSEIWLVVISKFNDYINNKNSKTLNSYTIKQIYWLQAYKWHNSATNKNSLQNKQTNILWDCLILNKNHLGPENIYHLKHIDKFCVHIFRNNYLSRKKNQESSTAPIYDNFKFWIIVTS